MTVKGKRTPQDNEGHAGPGASDRHVWYHIEEVLELYVWSMLLQKSPRPPDMNQLAKILRQLAYATALGIFRHRRSKNPENDAEDATQNWLTKMLEKLPVHYDFRGPVHWYAYQMFLNECANIGRNLARHDHSPLPVGITSRAEEPSQKAELNEVRAIVRASLDALPERHRRAIKQKYWRGHSSRTAARRMNTSVGSYNRMNHESRNKLRPHLSKWPELAWPHSPKNSPLARAADSTLAPSNEWPTERDSSDRR